MSESSSKRKRPGFSPPRPQTSKAKSTNANAKGRATKARDSAQKQKKSSRTSPPPSASEPSLDADSPQDAATLMSEPDYILAEITEDDPDSAKEPMIPLPLVHKLMSYHFQDKDKTRLTTDAREVLGKYLETFVKEAIMRSIYEAQKKGGDVDGDAGDQEDDGWLEVEHLERMAPQLVLDF